MFVTKQTLPSNMEMIHVDPAESSHHVKLVLLLIHGVIMLREWETVGDLQPVLNHQAEEGPLSHFHVTLWFFMAVLHYFHYRLEIKQLDKGQATIHCVGSLQMISVILGTNRKNRKNKTAHTYNIFIDYPENLELLPTMQLPSR